MAAGRSSQAKHMAAVHENWCPPHPSPVTGSKYSRSPALLVKAFESSLMRSASSSYLHAGNSQHRNITSPLLLSPLIVPSKFSERKFFRRATSLKIYIESHIEPLGVKRPLPALTISWTFPCPHIHGVQVNSNSNIVIMWSKGLFTLWTMKSSHVRGLFSVGRLHGTTSMVRLTKILVFMVHGLFTRCKPNVDHDEWPCTKKWRCWFF